MLRIIFLFFNMCWLFVVGQPTINERYIIDETTISAFTNVYSTDSCYYIGGIQTSSLGINNLESAWIRYKFDGTIDSLRVINNDTLGIGFWMTNKIIKTLKKQNYQNEIIFK